MSDPTVAKGSQLRIRQWTGDPSARLDLEQRLLATSPTLREWATGPIDWLSPLSDFGFRELRDDLWTKLKLAPTPQADGFWPAGGPVWDAVATVPGPAGEAGVVLGEAKSHTRELRSPRSKASPASAEIIDAALAETKAFLGVPSSTAWAGTFYQVANRLALLYWLRERAHRQAWLVNIYFLGDRFQSGAAEVIGPIGADGWTAAIAEAKQVLSLPGDHALEPWVLEVFLPARPAQTGA